MYIIPKKNQMYVLILSSIVKTSFCSTSDEQSFFQKDQKFEACSKLTALILYISFWTFFLLSAHLQP